MNPRLKVLIPLATSLVFLASLVILLYWEINLEAVPQGRENSTTREKPERHPTVAALSKPERGLPLRSPSAEDPYAPPERQRHDGRFHRWNLGELPPGWDPEVAWKLHELFEDLSYGRDGEHPADVRRRLERAYPALLGYLASLGPKALPTLGKILDVEPDFVARRVTFQTVGKLGPQSEAATSILENFYQSRYEEPQNRSEVGRVIEAMGHLKNRSSFETLTGLIRNDEHRPYRDKFVVALGDHPRREDALDIFVDKMHDQSFQTRNKSAQAMGKIRRPDTLTDLYYAYDTERVVYAKQTILGSIGKIGEPVALPFLEEQALGSQESDVRLSAAGAIRRIVQKTGDSYGLEVLHECLQAESDAGVHAEIERWVEELQLGEP